MINRLDANRLAEIGATMTEATDYPTSGIVYCGYWGVLERIISYDKATRTVECESITAINGGLRLLDKPEPRRTHCTAWDRKRDRIIILPEVPVCRSPKSRPWR